MFKNEIYLSRDNYLESTYTLLTVKWPEAYSAELSLKPRAATAQVIYSESIYKNCVDISLSCLSVWALPQSNCREMKTAKIYIHVPDVTPKHTNIA